MIDRPGFATGPRPSTTSPPPSPHEARRPRRAGHLAPLRELTLARIRIMIREPEVVFWVFLFPVLLALGLGVAFSDPAPERYLVVVEAGTEGVAGMVDPAADRLAERLRTREGIEVRILDPAGAERALRRGEAALVIAATDGRTVRYDPSRPEGMQARAQVELALLEGDAEAGGIALSGVVAEPVEQRGSRYIDWLIPGLIGFNLMSTGLWAMAYYITQMRQSRQLKRLSATPMRRSHFLAAQLLARFSFLVLEVPVIVLFAWLIFGVEVVGNPVALVLVVLLGAASFSALGLLAATRARTVESASGIINLLLLPMTVVSGVFFSASRFPDVAQPFIQALPLTALNEALRGIYNEGASLLALAPELGILLAWTVIPFALALRLFRWQ